AGAYGSTADFWWYRTVGPVGPACAGAVLMGRNAIMVAPPVSPSGTPCSHQNPVEYHRYHRSHRKTVRERNRWGRRRDRPPSPKTGKPWQASRRPRGRVTEISGAFSSGTPCPSGSPFQDGAACFRGCRYRRARPTWGYGLAAIGGGASDAL